MFDIVGLVDGVGVEMETLTEVDKTVVVRFPMDIVCVVFEAFTTIGEISVT